MTPDKGRQSQVCATVAVVVAAVCLLLTGSKQRVDLSITALSLVRVVDFPVVVSRTTAVEYCS